MEKQQIACFNITVYCNTDPEKDARPPVHCKIEGDHFAIVEGIATAMLHTKAVYHLLATAISSYNMLLHTGSKTQDTTQIEQNASKTAP